MEFPLFNSVKIMAISPPLLKSCGASKGKRIRYYHCNLWFTNTNPRGGGSGSPLETCAGRLPLIKLQRLKKKLFSLIGLFVARCNLQKEAHFFINLLPLAWWRDKWKEKGESQATTALASASYETFAEGLKEEMNFDEPSRLYLMKSIYQ